MNSAFDTYLSSNFGLSRYDGSVTIIDTDDDKILEAVVLHKSKTYVIQLSDNGYIHKDITVDNITDELPV